MTIRFDESESTAIAILTQYKQLPLSLKIENINILRLEYRPIGQLLSGITPNFITPEIIKAVNKLEKWRHNIRARHKIN